MNSWWALCKSWILLWLQYMRLSVMTKNSWIHMVGGIYLSLILPWSFIKIIWSHYGLDEKFFTHVGVSLPWSIIYTQWKVTLSLPCALLNMSVTFDQADHERLWFWLSPLNLERSEPVKPKPVSLLMVKERSSLVGIPVQNLNLTNSTTHG